jgi:ABC-type antimicrobial peptide transport system permease subunit
MLRAIGMTRRQARRMIRHESVITALIGAAMGLGLGVFLAALATQAMSSYGLGLTLPVTELVAFTSWRSWPGSGRPSCRPAGLAAQRAERAALRVSG